MKKLITVFSLFTLTFMSGCHNNVSINNPNNDKDTPEITASEILDNVKIGWNLGNTFDSHPGYDNYIKNPYIADPNKSETSWGNPIVTKELISYVKSLGFNSIRLPVTWYHHMDENDIIDARFINRIKEVIDYCIEEDLSVILNVHHDTGVDGWLKTYSNKEDKNIALAKFEKIWTQLSNAFKDYSNKYLLFEGFNEIINEEGSWTSPSEDNMNYVNTLNQTFVDIVRESGGNNSSRVLVVNSYVAGNFGQILSNFKIPTDTIRDAIIFQVHAYTPWNFCSGEVTTFNEEELTSLMKSLSTFSKNANIPVIIGEFGAVFNKGDIASKEKWFAHYIKQATLNNIKCYYWDDGGYFRLVNRYSLQVDHPSILNSMINNI